MPTCMLEFVCCDTCHEQCQRRDMSAFNGICARCFERAYQFCANCGVLTQVVPGYGPYHLNDGTFLCCSCRDNQQYGRPMCWQPTPLDVSIATYRRIGSKRKYGVEVETYHCEGFEQLKGKTKFGCKLDCSIRGREFPSPILYGDEGLAEIEEFLVYGAERHWSAGRDCGCHTHYDMRDESDQELYHTAYAYAKTYSFWSYCVSERRRDNSYCHAPRYTTSDVRGGAECNAQNHSCGDFKRFCFDFDRYDYVNLGAYNRYKTFEVRLLEGTVDAETICNWVMIHVRFIDYVKQLSFDDLDLLLAGNVKHVLSALVKIVDDVNLIDWLVRRIKEFSPGHLGG